MNRAVFLDRDGVINRAIVREGKPYPPATIAELEILPNVPSALAQLKAANFKLIVVTNQPDVARGTQTRSMVEKIHLTLAQQLPLDDFEVCYHDDADQCECRKPKPGMLLAAARKHEITLQESFLIEDRWRDIEAGQQAGCRTAWLDCGYKEKAPTPDVRCTEFGQAIQWILQTQETKQ